MKLPLLALLCVGTAAFCQSPAGPRVDPDKLFQMPEMYKHHEPNFGMLGPHPFRWNQSTILTHPPTAVPMPKPDSPQIDPKIILRPPWPGRGDESKGQDVSHLYPHLKLLPVR